ncbi:unnamed protein product [Ceutorhynchus assimilis]|uniref:Transcriptional adapter 1 n=1 Tax=Ceutorhynchus assimilis TaxID=467358 RepID=A0A9N9MRD2_9CUCU|nr:unnamed protein product [Ceutorhynchus assimilis]
MALELNEARKKLEAVLSEPLRTQYFAHLRQWFIFNPTLTKETFDEKVNQLFQTREQRICHQYFLLALLKKSQCISRIKQVNKGVFEPADYVDYVQARKPNRPLPSNYTYPRLASELFTPYSGFITCRINIAAWECGMEGADADVTQLIAHACQTFLKNIITAMITKAKGYKIRENKFQYGFNMPIPDPNIRNSNNIIDETVELSDLNEDPILPKYKKSLERTIKERAFAHAASKKRKPNVSLDTALLYETIRGNPKLLGLHGLHSVQLLKLSLHEGRERRVKLDEDVDSS